jgi:hypothetical protein
VFQCFEGQRLSEAAAAAETAATAAETAAAAATAETAAAATAAAAPETAAARTAATAAGSTLAAGTARNNGFARQKAFTLQLFAGELTRATDRLGFLARSLFRRFLEMAAELHLAENALALQFFLKRFESLINIVVANENLQAVVSSEEILSLECAKTPTPEVLSAGARACSELSLSKERGIGNRPNGAPPMRCGGFL